MRHLTRSRKWKHKEGRRTSHSYWSWTHGPSGTTHGTSRKHPWRWRVSRRWFLLPAGCRRSFSWAAPILKRRWQQYREEIGNKRSKLGVSSAGAKYRPRGAPRGATRQPGGQPARPRGATPGTLLGPWWWPSCHVLAILEASGTLIFYIIFPEFLEHF